MSQNFSRLFNLSLCKVYFKPIVFKSGIQLCARATVKKLETTPIHTKTDNENCISRKATIQTLEDLLKIRTLEAYDIISRSNHFQQVSRVTLESNYALYCHKRINIETIHKYAEILTVVDSEYKIKQLEKLPYNINVTAILLILNFNMLIKLVHAECGVSKKNSKLHILSSLLKLSQQKACEYLARKPFLISIPAEKIETNIKLLLEYGIKAEDICNDLWVLRYSDQLIKTRLAVAKDCKVDTMKTWMVRAQHEAFQTYIQRRSDNKLILGDNSLPEYLSERLSCSVAVANYLIVKQPALRNKSLKKLKELIDFLYSAGFQPQHICRVPKILVHSVETTRKRLKQLEEKGIQIDSLSMLTKSQNQFTQYYEALLKNKKVKSQT